MEDENVLLREEEIQKLTNTMTTTNTSKSYVDSSINLNTLGNVGLGTTTPNQTLNIIHGTGSYNYAIIEIVVVLGMIAFPVIKSLLNGTAEAKFTKGFLIGVNYNKESYRVTDKEENKYTMHMHLFQFHLTIITISMVFARNDEE